MKPILLRWRFSAKKTIDFDDQKVKSIDFDNSDYKLISYNEFTKPMVVQKGNSTNYEINSLNFYGKSVFITKPNY